ncbi:adenylate/guanylate cyclase domain-containing protein [Candidatus Peregrinibacteria bacterium]|nr:adenylate/guanylate cyclase domain-containing protein [Candidatus Peregrinibacteria bacterium]
MARSTLRPKREQESPEQASDDPKKLGMTARARLKIGQLVDQPWFEKFQRAATYTSVFAEPIYRGTCGTLGMPADEQVADVLRLGPLPFFAANLGLKTAARGMDHFKTPEPYIDAVSIAAEATTGQYVGNVRLARLVKGMKGARQVAKFMRATKVAASQQSLEDKSMQAISQDFTWYMVGMLAAMPLVADFEDLDYSNPTDTLRELGFNVGMIVAAKVFNRRIRKVINQNYTRTLDGSRDRVHQMIEENPELAFLKKEFEYFDGKAAAELSKRLGIKEQEVQNLVTKMQEAEQSSTAPSLVWKKWAAEHGVKGAYEDHAHLLDKVNKDEILVIVEGLLESMVSMKDLINPVGEDLELDENGDIKTKEIDAAVMVTDLRNFTPLTTSKAIQGNIFAFLKLNYFAYLKHAIKRHGGKILNHTGDGLVIYFTGREGKCKEECAVTCAEEIDRLTNLMDEVWHEQGVANPEDDHRTGIGISTGTLRIGDVLTLSKQRRARAADPDAPKGSPRGIQDIFDVQRAFEKEAMRVCDWIDVVNDERRQGGISRLVGMGEPINLAARLESVAKAFPDHTGFIRESHYQSMPPELQIKFQSLKAIQLKGVNEVEMIYGMKRMI